MAKAKTKHQIKCGGGLILLGDGRFAYFVELHIQSSVFHFESLDSWKHEAEAESELTKCISAFPLVIAKSANEKDFDLVERFCEEKNIIKIIPAEGSAANPKIEEQEEGEPKKVH
jgi:hypothetical protein